jgi:hypothetical protein
VLVLVCSPHLVDPDLPFSFSHVGRAMAELKRSVCPHDCLDTCGLLVAVEKGQDVSVTGVLDTLTLPIVTLAQNVIRTKAASR